MSTGEIEQLRKKRRSALLHGFSVPIVAYGIQILIEDVLLTKDPSAEFQAALTSAFDLLHTIAALIPMFGVVAAVIFTVQMHETPPASSAPQSSSTTTSSSDGTSAPSLDGLLQATSAVSIYRKITRTEPLDTIDNCDNCDARQGSGERREYKDEFVALGAIAFGTRETGSVQYCDECAGRDDTAVPRDGTWQES